MILKTFIFEATLRHKAPEDLVTLKCATCGETEVRVKHNLYTGHMHDMTCTYICKVCKGTMTEIRNNNLKKET